MIKKTLFINGTGEDLNDNWSTEVRWAGTILLLDQSPHKESCVCPTDIFSPSDTGQNSTYIYYFTTSRRPVFLINSCLNLYIAAFISN